ncbi:phage integrase N-terminal SAM-like domain-containing protein [Desulfosarcina widdelii]|uniref:phage integrase N-terminal SAM-like domain-containing protein n=1 Tax=Desulfosarcina widdelii TaxID=947919 RepID=UPI00339063D6
MYKSFIAIDTAYNRKVTSSTQNQALCALVFLYRQVLSRIWKRNCPSRRVFSAVPAASACG